MTAESEGQRRENCRDSDRATRGNQVEELNAGVAKTGDVWPQWQEGVKLEMFDVVVPRQAIDEGRSAFSAQKGFSSAGQGYL